MADRAGVVADGVSSLISSLRSHPQHLHLRGSRTPSRRLLLLPLTRPPSRTNPYQAARYLPDRLSQIQTVRRKAAVVVVLPAAHSTPPPLRRPIRLHHTTPRWGYPPSSLPLRRRIVPLYLRSIDGDQRARARRDGCQRTHTAGARQCRVRTAIARATARRAMAVIGTSGRVHWTILIRLRATVRCVGQGRGARRRVMRRVS